MEDKKELPIRKAVRLKNFNYSSCGAYFVTICTKDRRKILSQIVGGDVLDAPQNIELLLYEYIHDNPMNWYYDELYGQ